ncbi:MAG: hypothetical protein AAFW81_02535 [Pseudomonadota bacterium]
MNLSNLFKALFFVLAGIIGYLALTPDADLADAARPGLLDDVARTALFGVTIAPDLVTHFFAFAALGAVLPLARINVLSSPIIAFIALYAFGYALEYGQGEWNMRSNDLRDLWANALGAAVGLGIGYFFETVRRRIERLARSLRPSRLDASLPGALSRLP